MNDRRSWIRYSVCSSERLWSDCSTTILNFKIASWGLRPALLLRSSGFVSVTLSMSARKSSHRTIFLIVSNGSPLALIASSLRSTSKKPDCPMTRSLDPPMAHCGQRVRFVATWREEFFEVPSIMEWRDQVAVVTGGALVHAHCGVPGAAPLLGRGRPRACTMKLRTLPTRWYSWPHRSQVGMPQVLTVDGGRMDYIGHG